MDATPISFEGALPLDGAALPLFAGVLADLTVQRGTDLHDAAAVVAALAALPQEALPPELRHFLGGLAQAPAYRRELAEQGIEEMAAIMEPGLAALIAAHTAGRDVTAPARALWQEFAASRDTLLALVRPLD